MKGYVNLTKEQRLAQTKGAKGWITVFTLLAAMCFDQFVLDIPFANVVFPILIICAASMSATKNLVIVTLYSVLFELSCVAWFPAELLRAHWWLAEVWLGYIAPFAVYRVCNRRHRNISVWSYAAMAAFAEMLYFYISIAATLLIWKVDPVTYIAADLPYELVGCAATFVCALPAATCYKLFTGELAWRDKRQTARQML